MTDFSCEDALKAVALGIDASIAALRPVDTAFLQIMMVGRVHRSCRATAIAALRF